uniref:Large-conductance mechanosensitive channel n=1 Tax=mine drainage metagenome TaxID=410659 RepID=E6Q684_9ZZZZ
MRQLVKGFAKFLVRGKVVDLAVAVVIGGAAGSFINSFVSNFFSPLLAAIFGQHEISRANIVLNHSSIAYGKFIDSTISFFLVAVAVYFFVIVPSNRLAAKGVLSEPPDSTMKTCPECAAEIPKSARRCMYCTQIVEQS